MADNLNLTDLTNLANSSATATINSNNTAVENEFDKVLYKDGREALTGTLDANSQRIINLPQAQSNSEPVTAQYIEDVILDLTGGDINTQVAAEAVIRSANDATITSNLAAAGGADLIGAATGGTVEDAIWHVGRATPIAGSKMAIRWLRDDATFPLEDEAGIWPGKVVTDHGISAEFVAADGQAGSPCTGLFVMATNNGSPGDVCGVIFSAVARANSTTVFGANIIARGASAHSGVKYVGLEVDVVPNAGDTSINSASGGFYLNVFNAPIAGPAIQTGGVSTGTFGNGIILGGIASTGAGLALESSSQANSLVNTTVGTFNGVALTLGNGQSRGIRLSGTASTHAYIYNDGSNNVRHVLGSGAWVLRNSADAASLVSIDSGGNLNLEAGGTLRVSGTQVVGARNTGWVAMTGTANKATVYDTATVTLAQLAGRVMSMQAALTAHGLIGA